MKTKIKVNIKEKDSTINKNNLTYIYISNEFEMDHAFLLSL